jgi:hypothetical protein
MSDVGVPFFAVGPGTKTKQTMKVMAAGMTRATTTSSHVGIVSSCSKGYDIERSTGEKGRWKGLMYSQPAPTAAIALCHVSTFLYTNSAVAHVPPYLSSGVQKTVTAHGGLRPSCREMYWPTHIITTQSKMYDIISRFDGMKVLRDGILL